MPPDEPNDGEKDKGKKGNFFDKYRNWILIGVIILIGVMVISAVKSQSTTLASLKAQMLYNTQNITELRVNDAQQHLTMSAWVANITSSTQQQISLLPDWTAAISTLDSELNNAQAQIANLTTLVVDDDVLFPYALVTNIDSNNISAKICGDGEFSVFLTVFGSGMDSVGVAQNDALNYTMVQYPISNTTLTLCLVFDKWVYNDTIELSFNETIEYAYANTGR